MEDATGETVSYCHVQEAHDVGSQCLKHPEEQMGSPGLLTKQICPCRTQQALAKNFVAVLMLTVSEGSLENHIADESLWETFPYTGKPLSVLPAEVLINIFLEVYSVKEIESLGLVCTSFHEILRDFGYTKLFCVQNQLWMIETNVYCLCLKSQGLCRKLTAVPDSS